ncbi:MAG: polysaccharide deacetylase family protein [Bacilli bacterium]|nr:polysaccharide deacetylase family protein [Bacilli bacterium]
MFKKLLIIISLFVISGCTKINNDVVTIIHENDDYIASISYPITESRKLNKLIKKRVREGFKVFKNSYHDTREQFNVDFKYDLVNDRYINVVLEFNTNDSSCVQTFIFDIEKNKLLDIYDIFTKNDLDILFGVYLKDYNISSLEDVNFVFDDSNFYFYFDGHISNIGVDIFDLDITINKDTNNRQLYTYKEVDKVVDPKGKVVALTFDDGPSKYTKQIVDLLNNYKANATFFILGNKVDIYSDTLKYLLNSGNEIGNHSYNHKWLTHVSSDELISQITSTQDIIYNTLNYKPILFRPTYGSVNDTIRNNIDLDIVLWNVDTLDWKYKNGNKIASKALNKIRDGSIVLMHDTYLYTYDALKIMLPKLKEQGYQFVTVSELNEVNALRNAG